MSNDPFAVLGISSGATEDEIKTAYRRLAKKYHPDLNPGDKAAEAKMREVNEAYAEALRIKKGGGTYNRSTAGGSNGGYGSGSYGGYGGSSYGSGYSGGYGSGYGNTGNGYGGNEYRGYSNRQSSYSEWNPFSGFGFDPFGAGQDSYRPRQRSYANPDLQSAADFIETRRYSEAVNLLNRVPNHNADWYALYARADLGLGNRTSALDYARKAVQASPNDTDYQALLRSIENGGGGESYRQRSGSYDFKSLICSNPCLSCCALQMFCNCCLGGGYRGGFCI